MRLLAYVAASVTRFVSLEVLLRVSVVCGGFLAALGHCALVAVFGIVGVVYLAAEVGWAMKPRSGTNEYTAGEPAGSVVAVGSVAVGSAAVGSGFEVAVGALR